MKTEKEQCRNRRIAAILGAALLSGSMAAYALPALQLGPSGGDWSYVGGGDDTWYYTGSENPFGLAAYANATEDDGGNGAFAWDASGAANRYAYLVVSAVPQLGSDSFDLVVKNDGFELDMLTSGHGAPPVEDFSGMPSHGIFDTYFEIYEFAFNGLIGEISDTQPGETGTGQGYTEIFEILVSSTSAAVTGLHFDLFTVEGERYDPTGNVPQNGGDKPFDAVMKAFAPPSHDAQVGSSTSSTGVITSTGNNVPAPATLSLLGLGMVGGLFAYRRRRISPKV